MDRAQVIAALSERWTQIRQREDRFLLAVAAALLLHMLPLVAVTGGWWTLGLPRSAELGFGDPAGKADGINVEVIDAEEFDKRYVSFGKGRGSVDSSPARASPEQQARRPQEATEAREQAEQPVPRAEPKPEQPTPDVPMPGLRPTQPASRAPAPHQFTEQEIAQIVQSARQDFQDAVLSSSSASEARLGHASPYVRGIFRLLKQIMPRSNGLKGVVRIGLILDDDGSIAWLGVLRSSGRPELDRLVFDRIRAARFPAPPANAPLAERKFQVSFEYQ